MVSAGDRQTLGGRRTGVRFAFPAALLLLALGGCRALPGDGGGPPDVARPPASPDPSSTPLPQPAGGLRFGLVPEHAPWPAGEPLTLIAEWRNAAATRVWLPPPARLAALVAAGTRLVAADGSAVWRPVLAEAPAPGAAGNGAALTVLAPGELVTLRLTVLRLARADAEAPPAAADAPLPPGEYHLTAEFSTLGAGPEVWGAESWDRLWKGRILSPAAGLVVQPPATPPPPAAAPTAGAAD